MKKRFTDEQIIQILKEQEADEMTADLCRRYRISQATFYKYKSKYGGMELSDAARLRTLEAENGKLRDECLNENLFSSLADAKEMLKEWRDDYNQQRPHSSLGNLAPQEFADKKTLDKLAV